MAGVVEWGKNKARQHGMMREGAVPERQIDAALGNGVVEQPLQPMRQRSIHVGNVGRVKRHRQEKLIERTRETHIHRLW